MNDVFISYSRRNQDFARQLVTRLNETGRSTWIDWEGIPLSAPNWWHEIQTGIEQADNFVYILSPDSLASVVCNLELNHAFKINKRVVVVAHRDADINAALDALSTFEPDAAMRERLQGADIVALTRDNWQQLSHINWMFFRDTQAFEADFQRLVETVETDLDYVKTHTRYYVRAKEWHDRDQRVDLLLYGDEIALAERWLAAARPTGEPPKAPPPDPLHETYIQASRRAENRRRNIRRSVIVAVVALLVVAAGAGVFSVQATGQANLARTQVAAAEATLTPIPGTLTPAGVTLAAAAANVGTAQADTTRAVQQVIEAGATATQIPPTLTQAAVIVADAQAQQEIAGNFAQAAFDVVDGRGPAALTRMNDVVGRFADEAFAYLARGLTYANLFDYENALADYNTALQLNPDYALAYLNRGVAYSELGDYEPAITDFTTAIELDPEDFLAYYNRGNTYRETGDPDAAIADLTQAIALEDSNPSFYYNRANIYFEQGDYESALADFDEVLRLDPTDADALVNRGNTHRRLGQLEAALADQTAALELNPNDADAYINRGIIRTDLEDFDAAIEDLDAGVRLSPEDPAAYYNRGLAYSLRAANGPLTSLERDLNRAIDDWYEAERLGYELPPAIVSTINDVEVILGRATPIPTAPPETVGPAQPGDNNGTLAVGTSQAWTYSGQVGDTLTLQAIATWDTTLTVIGPDGDEIAYNDDDDALPNYNSRITGLTLPADGDYQIIVGSFDGRYSGTYTLRIE